VLEVPPALALRDPAERRSQTLVLDDRALRNAGFVLCMRTEADCTTRVPDPQCAILVFVDRDVNRLPI